MSSNLLKTKLHVPQIRKDRVNRPHLVSRLQKGMDKKLILVSAPAGYGKTTLVCEWLISCNQPYAWISLDKGDNDPNRFWNQISGALQGVFFSSNSTSHEPLYPQHLLSREILLTEIINDLEKNQQPMFLILDDYHNIDLFRIHEELSYLLQNAPEHFHLVLISRADPPFPLARMRACSQMMELRLPDLRFTSQEIAEFFQTVMKLELSPTDLSLLETTTEGWVAGLQMAGLSLQARDDISAFIKSFSGENRYILDFLFEEVFTYLSGDIQNFLMQTAILDRLCASLCNAVTSRENSQEILFYLEQNNLFLISIDSQRNWYRYHNLFGDLLKIRLKQSCTPSEEMQLHIRAAAWYENRCDYENALNHRLSAQDFEHAADLIEKIARSLDMQNEQAKLSTWLDKIPDNILSKRPWLCLYRAWSCYWTGRRNEQESWLQDVENILEKNYQIEESERQHIFGHIAAIRSHNALVIENIPLALEMGQKALKLLPEKDVMRSEAALGLAGAYWALGDVVKTKQLFGLAKTEALKINYTSMAAGVSGFIGLQQQKQGNLQAALITYRDALETVTFTDCLQKPISGFLNIRLGDLWREWNKLDISMQYLSRGLEQCRSLGQPDFLTDAYVCLARFFLGIGNLQEAQNALQKAGDSARERKVDPWVLCWLNDCQIRLWLADGNLDAAVLWAENSGLSPESPLNYQHDLHHQNLVRVLVAQGYLAGLRTASEKAEKLLSRLSKAAHKAGWVSEEIKILLMQAVNDRFLKNDEAAIITLRHAVSLSEPGGYIRVFVDEGKIIQDLLLKLDISLRSGDLEVRKTSDFNFLSTNPDYIHQLIAAFQENVTRPTVSAVEGHSPILVEHLSPREMEVLELLARGYQDKMIAENLVISRETVHKHLKNIYGKLGVHSRTEAIARARDLGLF